MKTKRWGPIDFTDRRWIFLLVLTGLAILLLLLLLLRLPRIKNSGDGVLPGAAALLKPEKRHNLSVAEAQRTYPMGDHILTLSSEQVIVRNFSGETSFAYNTDFSRPAAVDCGENMLVGDRASGRLLYISPNSLIFDTRLEGTLAGGASNGRDSVAVIEDLPEQNAQIVVYNFSGEALFTLEFSQSGNPLQVLFTNDGKAFDVLILNTSGSTLKTSVKRYDLKGVQIGQKQIEDFPELFTGLLHDKDDRIILYSSTHVLKASFDEEQPMLSAEFSAITGAFPNGSGLSVVAAAQQDGAYSVYEIDAKGEIRETEVRLGTEPILRAFGRGFCAVSGSRLQVYDQGSSRIIRDGLIDGTVLRVDRSGDRLNLLTEKGAEIIRP